MDALELRISELETQAEEAEKKYATLETQQQQTAALLQKTIKTLTVLNDAQQNIRAEQEEMQKELRTVQRHLDTLTSRTDALDETADILEDRAAELRETTDVLSRDMDNLYEDMNVLSAETRKRAVKLKEEIQRFLWDSTESQYDEESDTMW